VNGFADISIQKHYSNALNKVKAVLKHAQKEKIEILNTNTKLQLPSSLKNDYEYLSLLQNAISSKNIIELEYKNNSNEISQRRAELIGLIFYAFHWHVVAWDYKRGEYRDFRVSRILQVKNTGVPFLKSEHIELNEYMKKLPVNY
jgi:predicted DNA-binding transcriptional regulator YafY